MRTPRRTFPDAQRRCAAVQARVAQLAQQRLVRLRFEVVRHEAQRGAARLRQACALHRGALGALRAGAVHLEHSHGAQLGQPPGARVQPRAEKHQLAASVSNEGAHRVVQTARAHDHGRSAAPQRAVARQQARQARVRVQPGTDACPPAARKRRAEGIWRQVAQRRRQPLGPAAQRGHQRLRVARRVCVAHRCVPWSRRCVQEARLGACSSQTRRAYSQHYSQA